MAEITLAAATLTRPWTAAVKDGSVPAGPGVIHVSLLPWKE